MSTQITNLLVYIEHFNNSNICMRKISKINNFLQLCTINSSPDFCVRIMVDPEIYFCVLATTLSDVSPQSWDVACRERVRVATKGNYSLLYVLKMMVVSPPLTLAQRSGVRELSFEVGLKLQLGAPGQTLADLETVWVKLAWATVMEFWQAETVECYVRIYVDMVISNFVFFCV